NIHPRVMRCRLEGVSTEIDDQWPSRRLSIGGIDSTFVCRKCNFPIVVANGVQVSGLVKIENLMTGTLLFLALEEGQEIVSVEVLLEGLIANFVAVGHLLHHVWIAGSRQQRRHPVLMGDDVVVDNPGFDDAGPAHEQWNAETAFPGCAFLTEEGGRSAIRPG